jgi:hypothetical protein
MAPLSDVITITDTYSLLPITTDLTETPEKTYSLVQAVIYGHYVTPTSYPNGEIPTLSPQAHAGLSAKYGSDITICKRIFKLGGEGPPTEVIVYTCAKMPQPNQPTPETFDVFIESSLTEIIHERGGNDIALHFLQ